MEVPSGKVFSGLDLDIIIGLAKFGFVRYLKKPERLQSGVMSNFYVLGREDMTDNVEFEWLIGMKLAQLVCENTAVDEVRKPCVIGIPVAGSQLAQAAAMASFKEGIRTRAGQFLCHRGMREVPKDHGVHRSWVNGEADNERHVYWSLDNVVTNGGSKVTAAERLIESGYDAMAMPSLVFIDRNQGGIMKMKEAGFQRIVVAYELLDLMVAFRKLSLWSAASTRLVEEEIGANQFA
ncbi:MAG: hypothetical protein WC052_03235 [Patescibacteria group bacterium]